MKISAKKVITDVVMKMSEREALILLNAFKIVNVEKELVKELAYKAQSHYRPLCDFQLALLSPMKFAMEGNGWETDEAYAVHTVCVGEMRATVHAFITGLDLALSIP